MVLVASRSWYLPIPSSDVPLALPVTLSPEAQFLFRFLASRLNPKCRSDSSPLPPPLPLSAPSAQLRRRDQNSISSLPNFSFADALRFVKIGRLPNFL